MPVGKTLMYRELVSACFELHARRLWTRSSNEAVFMVDGSVPGAPWFSSILGAAGEEHGLALYSGVEGFKALAEVFGSEHGGLSPFDRVCYLGMTMDPLHTIPPRMRRPLDFAKFSTRRESLAPFIIAKDPGGKARPPRRNEAESLLWTLRAILVADDRGEFEPTDDWLDGYALLTLRVDGDPRSPEVEIVRTPPPCEAARREPDADTSAVPDASDLVGWKRVDASLTLRFFLRIEKDGLENTRSATRYFDAPAPPHYGR